MASQPPPSPGPSPPPTDVMAPPPAVRRPSELSDASTVGGDAFLPPTADASSPIGKAEQPSSPDAMSAEEVAACIAADVVTQALTLVDAEVAPYARVANAVDSALISSRVMSCELMVRGKLSTVLFEMSEGDTPSSIACDLVEELEVDASAETLQDVVAQVSRAIRGCDDAQATTPTSPHRALFADRPSAANAHISMCGPIAAGAVEMLVMPTGISKPSWPIEKKPEAWQTSDFSDYFPQAQVGAESPVGEKVGAAAQTERGSGSYDSTMTNFEAEHAAAEHAAAEHAAAEHAAKLKKTEEPTSSREVIGYRVRSGRPLGPIAEDVVFSSSRPPNAPARSVQAAWLAVVQAAAEEAEVGDAAGALASLGPRPALRKADIGDDDEDNPFAEVWKTMLGFFGNGITTMCGQPRTAGKKKRVSWANVPGRMYHGHGHGGRVLASGGLSLSEPKAAPAKDATTGDAGGKNVAPGTGGGGRKALPYPVSEEAGLGPERASNISMAESEEGDLLRMWSEGIKKAITKRSATC